MKTKWTEPVPFPRSTFCFLYDWYIQGYDQKTGDLDTLDIIRAQLEDAIDKVIDHNDPNLQLYVKGLRHALSVVEMNIDILRLRENTVRLKEHKCSVCGHDEFVFVEHNSSPKKYDIVCPVCGEVLDTIEKTL